MRILKFRSFDVPEGTFRAVFDDLFEVIGEKKNRIVFVIPELSKGLTNYCVGKNYNQNDTKLTQELQQWLGSEVLEKAIGPDGNLDPQRLKGIQAIVRVEHKPSSRYDKPFVELAEYWPEEIVEREQFRPAA